MTGDLRKTSAKWEKPTQEAPVGARQSAQAANVLQLPAQDGGSEPNPRRQRGGVGSASFIGLLATQLLGVTNDNAFRLLVIGICTSHPRVPPEYSSVIISIGLACFTLPYLLLAAPAGYCADRLSKQQVIVGCKVAEIFIMLAAIGAISLGSVPLILLLLLLMGAHSAVFSPSKYGAIPEMLRGEQISAANGLMGVATIAATVLGVVVGNWLFATTGPDGLRHLWVSAVVLIGNAILGTACSLLIRTPAAASPGRTFPWNVFRQTWRDLRTLRANRALLRVALGIAFFWSLGALAQSNILEFGAEGGMRQIETNPLLAALVLGVGLGSALAGVLSGGRVELGMLPLGAAGMAVGAMALFSISPELITPAAAWTGATIAACFWLFVLGASAGLFDVPLEAFLQHRSPPSRRGSILAASNFLSFTGILGAAGLYLLLRAPVIPPKADVGPPLASLPATQQQAIETARAQLIAQWEKVPLARAGDSLDTQRAPTPSVRALWEAAPADVDHQALLRELVQTDSAERRAHHRRTALRDYRPEFPDEDHVELIRATLGERAPLFTARGVFLLAGLFTIPIVIYIVLLIPDATLRFVVWLASKTFYRIRIHGLKNLPEQGGALLVSNHVSWLDGILLLLTAPRPVRMIADSQFVTGRVIGWMARAMQVIPLTLGSKSSLRQTLETARDALRRGELVCIFPEGGITRTGRLQPFKRGLLAVVEGTEAPLIPVFLDELWGSIFSFEGGRFFWKIPRRWPYPVSIYFGRPLPGAQNVDDVRRAVEQLGTHALEERMSKEAIPPKALLRTCRARRKKLLITDSLGEKLTGGQVLLRTLILRRLLLREVLRPDEKFVGILIPPSAGGVIVNAAMPLMGRIGVNLNYTLSKAEIDHCLRECGIRHVLSTRKVVEKLKERFNLQLEGVEIVYLDDLRAKLRFSDKLAGWFAARCVPRGILERQLGLDRVQPDDVLTVIFTSGSTAFPKGVMLTHRNVGSNVSGINGLIKLRENDVIAGALPFFHSLGYTATIWIPLMLGTSGAYHVSPLDYQIVGKLCRHTKATIFISTPTFLRGYLKRCQPEDFVTLDVVVAGAEKLPIALCDAFEKKFGVRPVEGYGTTELSPLVSCNIPADRRAGDDNRMREGSVGRPIPGVEAKVVDPETGAGLPPDHEGMLLVRGPNVMKGYLNHPDKTAEVIRDGWYTTGDMARIDADGFIFITGRLSRFSKIGGEMVPHLKIEEEIQRILGKEDELKAAVTAVPDEAKGERLVVLHVPLEKDPEQIRKELLAAGLPNLFVPARDSFCQVHEIPLLGSGKLDLKAVKRLALEKFK